MKTHRHRYDIEANGSAQVVFGDKTHTTLLLERYPEQSRKNAIRSITVFKNKQLDAQVLDGEVEGTPAVVVFYCRLSVTRADLCEYVARTLMYCQRLSAAYQRMQYPPALADEAVNCVRLTELVIAADELLRRPTIDQLPLD